MKEEASKKKYTHTHAQGFPGGSDGKESAHSVGDPGLVPRSGRYTHAYIYMASQVTQWARIHMPV